MLWTEAAMQRPLPTQFWALVLRRGSQFEDLSACMKSIADSAHAAKAVFRLMLRQHPTNVPLLRAHSKFLVEIADDPWRAAAESEKADRIEDQQVEVRMVESGKKGCLWQELGCGGRA